MYSRRAFFGTFLGGFFGLGSYAFGVEPLVRLTVKRYDLPLARWPIGAPPLRIAVVADLHAVDPWMNVSRIREIVAATNALRPELTLLLGDYVSTTRIQRREILPAEWAPPLAALSAPLGVFAVLGNHDYSWHGGPEPVRKALEAAGIPVLVNHAHRVDAAGHAFWLTGTASILSNPRIGFPRGPGIWNGQDDLAGTLAQVTDDAPIIHLAHEPDLFPHVSDRVALTISGHTHGGQVRLPLLGRPVIPSVYGQRYAYGHIRESGRDLVVSGGLGCSGLPVRFGVPPEIVVATVRSADAEPSTS